MKKEENIQNYSKTFNVTLNKVLFFVVCALILIIVIVSLATILVKPIDNSNTNQTASSKTALKSNDFSYFSALGKIRTFTKDEFPIPIVVSVYFPYPTDDFEFYEELISKQAKFKLITEEYFKQFTKTQLQKKGEVKIQSELLNQFNDCLVLDKITKLFFSEYIFFD